MALEHEITCVKLNAMKISIDTLTENSVSYTMKYRGKKVPEIQIKRFCK
jgi:hypothetical protein